MANLFKFSILCFLTKTITHTVSGNTLQHHVTESTLTNLNDYETVPDITFQIANLSAYNCEEKICVIKCCPEGFLYYIPEFDIPKCVEVGVYNMTDWKPRIKNNKNVVLIYGLPPMILHPQAPENMTCGSYDASDEYYLKGNGRVYFYALKETFLQNSYCIDYMHKDGKIRISSIICHKVERKSQYVIVTDKLHVSAIAVSCFFLFLILLFFALTPHYLDLQKKCTISCCINLFLGFLVLLINNTPVVIMISNGICLTLGFLTQFFFLSFYFWLNVTCFEISRIIRGTFRLQSISDLTQSSSRFLFYCGYAWGFTLLICSITVTMQLIPLKSFPESIRSYIIKPHINEGRCWLQEGLSEYVYYYVIEIFLHIVNAIFMGYTGYLLHREKILFFCCGDQNSTTLRTHASTNYLDAFKQQLRIYVMYLFIWILNTITLINKKAYIWKIVDIIVALQGLFLFLFIIQTSKTLLLIPFYEKLSNKAKEVSNRIEELKNSYCNSTETSGFYSKSDDSRAVISSSSN